MGGTVYTYIFKPAGGYEDGLGVGGCHKIQKSFITDPIFLYLYLLNPPATATTVAATTTIKHAYFTWKDRSKWDHAFWETEANRSSDHTIDNA